MSQFERRIWKTFDLINLLRRTFLCIPTTSRGIELYLQLSILFRGIDKYPIFTPLLNFSTPNFDLFYLPPIRQITNTFISIFRLESILRKS